MKRSTILTIFGILCLLIIFVLLKNVNSEVQYINEITQSLKNDTRFVNIIESVEADYDKQERQIELILALKDDYDKLSTVQQYSLLDHFNKLLRYNLLDDDNSFSFEHISMSLIAKTTTNHYLLSNLSNGNNVFTDSNSALHINGREVFTSNDFRQQKNKYLANLPNNAFEKEVLDYANYFYTFLTHSGKYFELNKDPEIIIDAVCKKFNISQIDFLRIYITNVLKMIDAS